jgi:hypothetical protein
VVGVRQYVREEERKVREVGGGWRGKVGVGSCMGEMCVCGVYGAGGEKKWEEWQEYCSVYCVLGVCAENWCVYWVCVCTLTVSTRRWADTHSTVHTSCVCVQ